MSAKSKSDQATWIVHALASLPGCTAVNVTAKKFPRLGPAEPGTGYEERARSFSATEVPDVLDIPSDVEEIIITLEGELPPTGARQELEQKWHGLLESGLSSGWDARVRLCEHEDKTKGYELMVFTDPYASAPLA